MKDIAQITSLPSENITMVASATKEMTATINEIVQNTQKANEISGQAVDKALEANSQIETLIMQLNPLAGL